MKNKNSASKIYKLKIKKKNLYDLPVFYNYIIYNRFIKGRLLAYHYDRELQCYINYYVSDKPISKV